MTLTQVTTHPQYTPDKSLLVTLQDLNCSPLVQFSSWFEKARTDKVPDPEAFVLSTANKNGIPSSRVVLLRTVDETGFTFFTNYTSRKGTEIEENSGWVGMNFYWAAQNRQIRVVGKAEKVDKKVSQEYFSTRPIMSRVGAWASHQSAVIDPEREWLEKKVEETAEKLGVKEGEEKELQVPDFWGGYKIVPVEMEFWVGSPNRLHDRFRYQKVEGSNEWKIERLGP